jgi:hypothetical protein
MIDALLFAIFAAKRSNRRKQSKSGGAPLPPAAKSPAPDSTLSGLILIFRLLLTE